MANVAFGRRKAPPETRGNGTPLVSNQSAVQQPAALRSIVQVPVDEEATLGETLLTAAPRLFPLAREAKPHVLSALAAAIGKSPGRSPEPHLPTLLTEAGALAGFAAQQAIWQSLIYTGRAGVTSAFTVAEAEGGATYFFGELLNTIIADEMERHLSIWRLIATAAIAAGASELPDIRRIFAHVAVSIDGSDFGIPVLPVAAIPRELPLPALKRLWSPVRDVLVAGRCDPMHWPLFLAATGARLIGEHTASVEPSLAALIFMEAAIPMSKVDPMTVPGVDRKQCGILPLC